MDYEFSFGKGHNFFFLVSGMMSMLVWSSVITLDSFWTHNYRNDASMYYTIILFAGALMALFFYDKFNRYFSFKTQLRYFPFGIVISLILLYLTGEYMKPKPASGSSENPPIGLKHVIWMILLLIQGVFSAVLQISLTRYTFNFSSNEISLFNVGISFCAFFFALMQIIIDEFINPQKADTPQDSILALYFITISLALAIVSFFVFQNYIKNFLDKKDDLTGETDSLREIVDNEEKTTLLSDVFKKILAMFFCLILCHSVTLSCFPTLTSAVGNKWLSAKYSRFKGPFIALIFTAFDGFGKYAYRFMRLKDNIGVYIYSLLRLLLVLGYIFATDKKLSNHVSESPIFGYSLLIFLAFTNGHFTTAAYSLACQRCENKSKKTCGYLMTVSLYLGLIYGSIISGTCLEDKTPVA